MQNRSGASVCGDLRALSVNGLALDFLRRAPRLGHLEAETLRNPLSQVHQNSTNWTDIIIGTTGSSLNIPPDGPLGSPIGPFSSEQGQRPQESLEAG